MSIGQKIRELREAKELSLNKLAEKASISPAYLSHLENDKSKDPSYSIARRLAVALDVTTEYLFGGAEMPEQKCKSCLFYKTYKDGYGDTCGNCWRYPPVPVTKSGGSTWEGNVSEIHSEWERPPVDPDDFCGEWKVKP